MSAQFSPDTISAHIKNEKFVTIGICMPMSGQGTLCELAISMAGYCFVPIDTERIPKDRIHVMMEDSQCKVVITTKKYEHLFSDYKTHLEVLLFDDCCYASVENFTPPRVSRDHVAYMIYTSGTTGRPKRRYG
eukprot:UN14537